jgi:hypothetical protein
MAGRAAPISGSGSPVVEDPSAQEADARTWAKLRKPINAVKLDGVPLSDALSFVSEAVEFDIVADWKSMEASGIDQSSPVSMNLRDRVPAEQVLQWILRSAAGEKIAFAIDHGLVVVSNRDQIDRMTVTRSYDVQDLRDRGGQNIAQLLRELIAPGTWRNEGGWTGNIAEFDGKLLITQTEPNHREIEKLLGLMRGGESNEGKGDSARPARTRSKPDQRPTAREAAPSQQAR